MQRFAALLDRLVLTRQRTVKLRLIVDFLRTVPDRSYALAALTGDLDIQRVKPAMLRALVKERVDEALFAHSYDYVGEIVERLLAASRGQGRELTEAWLDGLDASGRWALLKLTTGGLRVGVSG